MLKCRGNRRTDMFKMKYGPGLPDGDLSSKWRWMDGIINPIVLGMLGSKNIGR